LFVGGGKAGDPGLDPGGTPWLIPFAHAETRPADREAIGGFFAEPFGWSYSDVAYPGYTFVETGVEGAPPAAISPLQGDGDVACSSPASKASAPPWPRRGRADDGGIGRSA
jgi:hypothetical protein